MGISGIVSNESLTQGEIEEGAFGKMKADFYNEATGTSNARKLLMTTGKWNYTEIGLSPVDMELLNSMKLTFKKACNLFGVSDRLFNNDATGSEISVDIAYKDLYTNAALPEVYALRDSLNKSLVPKFNKGSEKYFIDCDITGITELQDDFKDMALIYGTLPIMNPAVIAKAFSMDYDSDDPNMDKWFIKQGYQTVDDAIAGMGGVPPLPIDTENGN
jgi:HK97 family phage portal protein